MGITSSNYFPVTSWWQVVLAGWITGILYGVVARGVEWLLMRGVKLDYDDVDSCNECGARVAYDIEYDLFYCTVNPDHYITEESYE